MALMVFQSDNLYAPRLGYNIAQARVGVLKTSELFVLASNQSQCGEGEQAGGGSLDQTHDDAVRTYLVYV